MAEKLGSSLQDWRIGVCVKGFLKFLQKMLAGFEKMRTFAAPLKKRVLAREDRKFIEKTVLLYKKQVPRNTIYREALILLKGIISVRTS